MTVVAVGYLPDKGGRGALDLAVQLARATDSSVLAITVVPQSWGTPSLAKVDAEYSAYAAQVGTDAERRGRDYLATSAPDVAVDFHVASGRSVSSTLVAEASAVEAIVLVLGSSSDGPLGQVVTGSTASRLLHSSPLALALSPRGYHPASSQQLTRITCAFSDTGAGDEVVRRARELADEMSVPLRVVTFGVRQGTMFPPEVGLHAEDGVLDQWSRQASASQVGLITNGVVAEGTDTLVATGAGWSEAVEAVEWEPGDLLIVGSSRSPIAQVFLGSRATKVVRHAPVPVLVVTGAAVTETA